MYKKNDILAVILARGGSKGIPKKNIKPLNSRPLIYYTISEAQNSDYIDRLVVSTDDNEIAKTSKKYGAEVPFKRPEYLASDEATSIDAIIHTLNWLDENESFSPEYVMLLQPTSPLRRVKDIDDSIEQLIENKGDSLISLKESEKHPYWMMEIQEGLVEPFSEKKEEYSRRQDLPAVYEINGAIYLARTDLLLEEKTLSPGDTLPYVMPKERSIDIDDIFDWKIAELLLKEEKY